MPTIAPAQVSEAGTHDTVVAVKSAPVWALVAMTATPAAGLPAALLTVPAMPPRWSMFICIGAAAGGVCAACAWVTAAPESARVSAAPADQPVLRLPDKRLHIIAPLF